ncbi:MAG: ROK family protein, partial [bacterium]
MRILGIDIGGTKTAICVGNESGKILSSIRIPTLTGDSMKDYFLQVRDQCNKAVAQAGIKLKDVDIVGISAPGPLSVPKGTLIAPPNNPGWKNVPIVKIIKDMLKRPVVMNNDANAAVLAEYFFGEYRGTKDLVYLTFSTGMGGGIVAAGRLVQGITDMGGEVGHLTLDINGPRCGCGKNGCWEAYVGGKNLAEQLKKKIKAGKIKTLIVDKAGGKIDQITTKSLADAARAGDPFAVAEWDTFMEHMAHGMSNIIMILNPEVIVLGTIAIHERDLVLKPLRKKLARYAWEWPLKACKIVPSKLGVEIGELAALAVGVAGLDSKRAL